MDSNYLSLLEFPSAYETLLHNFEIHWSPLGVSYHADENWIPKFHKTEPRSDDTDLPILHRFRYQQPHPKSSHSYFFLWFL